MDLYRRPEIYDIAFSWEFIDTEMDRYEQCFRRFADGEAHRLLEPACGSGRFLVRFPGRGYRITGYDRSPEMLAYSKARLKEEDAEADLVCADMREPAFGEAFDAAFNAVNSVGYLLTDEDFTAHIDATARALRPGGIYVLQLTCAQEDGVPEPPDDWVSERDGLRVTTNWSVVDEDRERRLSHQRCRMEIEKAGRTVVFEEPHTSRLWFDEEFRALAEQSGAFRHVGIVDFRGSELPPDSRITGADGILYRVLRRI